MIKLIIITLVCFIVVCFLVMPAAIGYWTMFHPEVVEPMTVPFRYWIAPFILLFLFVAVILFFYGK